MTIEDLAAMMQRNFPSKEDFNNEINSVKGYIKRVEVKLSEEINEVKLGLWDVKVELEEVHEVVKRIDVQELPNLKRRVTNLETIIKPLRK